jgi:hypothetical protein
LCVASLCVVSGALQALRVTSLPISADGCGAVWWLQLEEAEEETTSENSGGEQAPFETWEGPAIERVLGMLFLVPCYIAMKKLRIVVRVSHAAVSRRPLVPLYRIVARTHLQMYTANVRDLSIVQDHSLSPRPNL